MITRCLLALLFAFSLQAQANLDIEKGTDGAVPDGWSMPPKAPYLEAKKVFLADGSAISYPGTRHRTQAGVAAGRDEVLERGVTTLKSKP